MYNMQKIKDENKTISKSEVRQMKNKSPYLIEELVLLSFGWLNDKKGEENNEETETLHQKRKGQIRRVSNPRYGYV